MRAMLAWLSGHPLIAIALVLVAVGAVASIVKKLVKVALVLLIVLAVGGGAIFGISQRDIADTGEKFLRKAGDEGKELLEDAGQRVESEVRARGRALLSDDSMRTPAVDTTSRSTGSSSYSTGTSSPANKRVRRTH